MSFIRAKMYVWGCLGQKKAVDKHVIGNLEFYGRYGGVREPDVELIKTC